MENIKYYIRVFNYYWDLLIPLLMAVVAIYYASAYSIPLIAFGWLGYVIYLTFEAELREYKISNESASISMFFIRLPLLLFIPASNGELTLKDYFYSEVLAELVALNIVVLFMFVFHKKESGEKLSDVMGWFTVLLLIGFLGFTIYPFAMEIYSHLIQASTFGLVYFGMVLIPGLYYNYRFVLKLSRNELIRNGADEDFAMKSILFGLFTWFFGLGILYALKQNAII